MVCREERIVYWKRMKIEPAGLMMIVPVLIKINFEIENEKR